MTIPKEDERTPGPTIRNQVADQCKVVAALADIVSKVNSDYERLLRDPEVGPKMENILDIVGKRTARVMEYLGDVLNGMDAATDEDEWMTSIFESAHKMFPVTDVNAYASTEALRSALEEAKAALNTIRNASLKGCEYGYGKPEQFADELYRSHGDVHRALVKIDAALSGSPAPSTEGLREALAFYADPDTFYSDYDETLQNSVAPSAGVMAPSEVDGK